MGRDATKRGHVAFILESTYGHLLPTVGLAAALLARGYRVSYAVSEEFGSGIARIGAEPRVYRPLDYRVELLPQLVKCHGGGRSDVTKELWRAYQSRELQVALGQLTGLYGHSKPDLILYDLRNLAGKALAARWGIPVMEHSPMVIEHRGRQDSLGRGYDERFVLIGLPRLFQSAADALDERFHFAGFCPERRDLFFDTWSGGGDNNTVLVAGTTAGPSQAAFFDEVVAALAGLGCRVVLSLGQTVARELRQLPPYCHLNPHCANFSILKQCRLYIGQGGQGSTLEALYWGVPVILMPPYRLNDLFIERVVELGVGVRVDPSEAAPGRLREIALHLLGDGDGRQRAQWVSEMLQRESGSECAAALIERDIGH